MTDKTFKAGDRVARDHSQGASKGKVVRRITQSTKVKSHTAAASKDKPEHIVESDKTGARAAHRPSGPRKL